MPTPGPGLGHVSRRRNCRRGTLLERCDAPTEFDKSYLTPPALPSKSPGAHQFASQTSFSLEADPHVLEVRCGRLLARASSDWQIDALPLLSPHFTTIRLLFFSHRPAPTPCTLRTSSGFLNGPCASRYSMIFSASFGPMPSSV